MVACKGLYTYIARFSVCMYVCNDMHKVRVLLLLSDVGEGLSSGGL